MANIQKYLDKAGVSVLWTRIAEELVKNQEAANEAVAGLKTSVDANTSAIELLNGNKTQVGSVAHIAAEAVAEIVAGADASFDTLKEIADWIANDTTGAAAMANDISALEALVGDTAVATQISEAISTALTVDGVDKYALAADLTTLAGRVSTLEGIKIEALTETEIDEAIAAASAE